MDLRKRLEWFGRLGLLIFILASVTFLSAITTMRLAIQGREVQMPDLVGKKAGEAQALLQRRGLGMRVEDRVYNERPLDSVVRQSPSPGLRVKTGQRAHVVLSLGPQRVTIPAVETKSLRAARIELLRDGLQIGELSAAYLTAIPADTVIQQNPGSGTIDASSPHVDLLASLGARPPAYVMPDLVGATLSQAQERLAAAGLIVSKITAAPVPGAELGAVTSQTPARGARIEAGGAVELEVAE